MKSKIKVFCMIVLLVTILFFPVTTTYVISDSGQVLTIDKEELSDCTLSIEIKEVISLAFCYSKTFSFILDGTSFSDFGPANYAEAEDQFCMITQMFYDKNRNLWYLCSLIYDEELSYAVISLDEELYFINPGENMPLSELPIS